MVKNTPEQITIAAAGDLGLQPCKVCHPPRVAVLSSSINEAQGEGETLQCKGLTKMGSRWRHMTRIANGYWFQHQP